MTPNEAAAEAAQKMTNGGDTETTEGKPKKLSVAAQLIALARQEAELFTTPGDGTAYAVVTRDGCRQTWALRSRGFKTWLARRLYEVTQGKASAGAQALGDATTTLEGFATHAGGQRPVHLRSAELGGKLYLDLADERWRAVEITATGWNVMERPPVHFRRTRGTLPLPVPARGGSLLELQKLLNVGSDDDFRMIVAWLLAAMRPRGPYPLLDLSGEQGTAKTTTARVLRFLIDPGAPMVRAAPREERDLAIAVLNGHVLALDNLSGIQPWLSDALCRFSTGGGWACRALYTDDEEVLIDAQRPIILTGIEELALRPDLKDRSIGVQLPVLPDERREQEAAFWQRAEAARPRILGALLDVVLAGLAQLPKVRLARLPRMADFAKWIAACEPALGWAPGSFAQAYADNRVALTTIAIEGNDAIKIVQDSALCHGQHETVGALLTKLRSLCEGDKDRAGRLPKTPRHWAACSAATPPSCERWGST